jgi:hypothetical protein
MVFLFYQCEHAPRRLWLPEKDVVEVPTAHQQYTIALVRRFSRGSDCSRVIGARRAGRVITVCRV